MKLEIDIDEDYYKIICKRVQDNKPFHSPYEYEVIADGKPLEQEPTTKNNLAVDCISRDDVRDVMQELWGTSGELMDRLMALPSVTPQEPRKGHWIKRKKWDMYVCSKCSHETGVVSNFCPNCGADMRADRSEE